MITAKFVPVFLGGSVMTILRIKRSSWVILAISLTLLQSEKVIQDLNSAVTMLVMLLK